MTNFNVEYGTVTGRVLAVGGDNADGGRAPNARANQCVEVVFKPTVKLVRDVTRGAVIHPLPVTARLDHEGYLTDDSGERGVSLMATTGVGVEPSEWAWEAHINLPAWKPVAFTLTPGQTVDLATLVDVEAQPNTVTKVDAVLADEVNAKMGAVDEKLAELNAREASLTALGARLEAKLTEEPPAPAGVDLDEIKNYIHRLAGGDYDIFKAKWETQVEPEGSEYKLVCRQGNSLMIESRSRTNGLIKIECVYNKNKEKIADGGIYDYTPYGDSGRLRLIKGINDYAPLPATIPHFEPLYVRISPLPEGFTSKDIEFDAQILKSEDMGNGYKRLELQLSVNPRYVGAHEVLWNRFETLKQVILDRDGYRIPIPVTSGLQIAELTEHDTSTATAVIYLDSSTSDIDNVCGLELTVTAKQTGEPIRSEYAGVVAEYDYNTNLKVTVPNAQALKDAFHAGKVGSLVTLSNRAPNIRIVGVDVEDETTAAVTLETYGQMYQGDEVDFDV